ncbi:hypothetical protein GCM10010401_12620 [Rarobacter faecitabidus]|uniref:Ricin-type beta-trefoil lectin protein n=1 Tax=Rarobacter faecitabidus TaxID=13243 RepID=A0A542Z8L1_RARFA|nr:RICIN domain-containing protein [Rarobacter faecitabidus]TQL56655.1 ricin-type beta-trefoil lectin protein [Rarobacter faecitabidus]
MRQRIGYAAAAPIALLTMFCVVIGSTAAFAYWTSAATANGTATTRSVSATSTGFGDLQPAFANHSFLATAYTAAATGNFVIINSGQTAGTMTFTITAPGAVPALLPIHVWPVASAAVCTAATTVPGSAGSGTWASYSMSTPVSLAVGAAQRYCVRTSVTNRQTLAQSGGSTSASAALTVTFDDADGWAGTVNHAASTTVNTELIYPYAEVDSANYVRTGLSNWFTISRADTGLRLDVSGSSGGGTRVITWTAHSDSSQRWEILPVGAANPNLVRLRPRHSSGLGTRLAHNASNDVLISTLNASATNQLWEIQRVSNTTFQLIAHTTGRCLAMNTASGGAQLSTAACSAAAADRANQVLTLTREPLTFTNGTNVTFAWNSNSNANYRAQRLDGSTWTNVGTATNGTSLSFARGTGWLGLTVPTGTSQWRIVIDGTSTVIFDGITLNRNSGNTITATDGVG